MDATKKTAVATMQEALHWQAELTTLYCKAVGFGLDRMREGFILSRWDRAIRSAVQACRQAGEPAWVMQDLQRMRDECSMLTAEAG